MANLGFVGLGSLGSQIAKRLMDAGHDVTGHNRTKSKADWLVEAGMKWAATPRAVADAADMTFSMIRDNNALRDINYGADGIIAGLKPGKIYADMSTVSPLVSQEIAAKVAETGAQMLDAPVSGSKITLKAGNMSIMVGGDEDAFEKVKPLLLDIGPNVSYLGPNGYAAAIKLAINLTIPTQILAFAEGLLLAEKFGISRELAVEVMMKSPAASFVVSYYMPHWLEEPDDILFNMDMMQKDVQMALEMGRELEVPMLALGMSNEMLNAGRAMGLSEKNFSALLEVLERMAGLK